ncbi:cystathionine beta-lyase [Breoghania corrubedonensis]|uniref:Cystathionine beta-lyase n=1 Tax=Breoghania corrubedonensis TaxID=665038 RepID=A0A2T5VBB0_9HYPH|nr:cystathionine beta-lyase [Breoghania corrubedonensis]PTW61027.1 cystathionine beta-lyase [Breoghania corrubedonensis]
MTKKKPDTTTHPDTLLAHIGRHPQDNHGFVNPPVIHASTVLFPDIETMIEGGQRYTYARRGTPTSDALEEAVSALEGAAGTRLAPSGLAAIAVALQSCLSAGDHLLVADSVYGPCRNFCNSVLNRFGVSVSYYDPLDLDALEAAFRPETRAVFTEAPGSLTFEMQDIPAIAEMAHKRDAIVLNDNTWASPLYFKPIEHGVDLSIQAGTKYIVGHSDVMLGTVAASERAWKALEKTHGDMGMCAGPDDIYLALRGLRTMGVRLERHMKNALEVAGWLSGREEVAQVFYPALPGAPGHEIWKRDFAGASGLFSVELAPASDDAVKAFINALEIFGLGYSWGGFESLLTWPRPKAIRTATSWDAAGPLLRLHIGLEDPADLIADLEGGFAAFNAART